MKILVIEDEAGLRESIVESLEKEQFIVETAIDLHTARQKAGIYEYDCILLDIGLPGGGFEEIFDLFLGDRLTIIDYRKFKYPFHSSIYKNRLITGSMCDSIC